MALRYKTKASTEVVLTCSVCGDGATFRADGDEREGRAQAVSYMKENHWVETDTPAGQVQVCGKCMAIYNDVSLIMKKKETKS